MRTSTYQRLKSWFNQTGESEDRSPRGMHELEPRLLLSAVLTNAIPDQYISAQGGTASINLNAFFDNTDITGTLVRYDTVFGDIDVELFDTDTPATVQNFLNYVDRGDYDGTFFHRNALLGDSTPFVVQGGGFSYESGNTYNEVTADAAVLNEPGISNTRGTIAMAKLGGDPDSATNQWFFNMGDNSANLDAQNGGFTVFGEVKGNGMVVVDQIAATPVWDASSLNSAFNELPLRDFTNDHFPNNNDLVVINSVTRLDHELTFSVVANSSPSRVAVAVSEDGVVTIFTVNSSKPETVTITIEAEDYDGNTTQTTFTVEVGEAKESLDNDRFADMIWRDFKSGKNTLWDMQGMSKVGAEALRRLKNSDWYIAAVGDLNQDGSNDLLWRNAYDGRNRVWLMDGTTFVGAEDLRTVANRKLTIGGIADFNNDGKADILWRNAKHGKNFVWTMDGTAEAGTMRLKTQSGSQWYIGGVGDFDRDGATDIVWRNEDGGQNKVWLLNPQDGTLKQSVALLSEASSNWVISGVADWNVNNDVDILWRNVKNGKQMVWVMSGTTRINLRTDLNVRRNQSWQLPGRTSQQVADQKATAKIQRQQRRAARLARLKAASASASVVPVTASAHAAESTTSVLGMVEPIFNLDLGDGDADAGFVLNDDGQVVN